MPAPPTKKYFAPVVAKTASVSPLVQWSQLSSHQKRHVMVDFRFRKSWWQTNGEAVHFRLEHACFTARRAIRSGHSRLQFDYLAIHGKSSVAVMVNGLRILPCRVRPSLEHLQNEEIEFVDEMGIDYIAFEVGEALGNQRRRNTLGWCLRQAESLELVDIAARAITYSYDYLCQTQRRNSDYAFLRRSQCSKAVIGVTHDTSYHWRFKIYHHMPRHSHDIGLTFTGGRQQNHRAGFEQLVDLRQRQILHGVCNS